MVMHFVDNLTYRQIADKENASPASIGRSIKRALQRLNKHLSE
ncbi:hypothetical protein LJC07_02360 [Christensenellaceae bacterium OttesenSCG-928-L17]|nr:hypothetical protein [Christensenellaceae bacterium OttesenSCG-928-L17]